jgi:hypothetical protein
MKSKPRPIKKKSISHELMTVDSGNERFNGRRRNLRRLLKTLRRQWRCLDHELAVKALQCHQWPVL